MKYLSAILLFFFISLISCQDLADQDLFHNKDHGSIILYPQNGETWYVGQQVNITFQPVSDDETVSVFFYKRGSKALAGGPLSSTQSVFYFTVPPEAQSDPAVLLAVRRQQNYLQAVDVVLLHILPPI